MLPKGVDMASRQVYDGISLRFVRDYTIADDQFPARFDVLYGSKAIVPNWPAASTRTADRGLIAPPPALTRRRGVSPWNTAELAISARWWPIGAIGQT